MLAHHQSLAGLCAPTVNAYKRLRPASLSGYWANWGYDHRGATVRIPPSVVKVRDSNTGSPTARPSCTPHWRRLASGTTGVVQKLTLGPKESGNGLDTIDATVGVPSSLSDALDALEADQDLVDAVGANWSPSTSRSSAPSGSGSRAPRRTGRCASISRSSSARSREPGAFSSADEVRSKALARTGRFDARPGLAISSNMTRSSSRASARPDISGRCGDRRRRGHWRTIHDEFVGIGELVFVEVRRDVPEDDLVALLQGLAAQFVSSTTVRRKCMVVLAQRSTSSTSNLIRASSMAGSAANISGRSMKTWARRSWCSASCRCGRHHQREEVLERRVIERVAVFGRRDQGRQHVVRRRYSAFLERPLGVLEEFDRDGTAKRQQP